VVWLQHEGHTLTTIENDVPGRIEGRRGAASGVILHVNTVISVNGLMKQYQEILNEVYEGLAPFAKGEMELSEDTELVGELGLDSMQVMELLLTIEDRFDISVPVNIVPDVVTVGDLARQIHQLVQNQS